MSREQRIQNRIASVLSPYLWNDEALLVVSEAESGGHPLLSYFDGLYAIYTRLYYLGLTEARILLVKSSQWLPDRLIFRRQVHAAYIHDVRVGRVKETNLYLSLWLQFPNMDYIQLDFEPAWMTEAKAIISHLLNIGTH